LVIVIFLIGVVVGAGGHYIWDRLPDVLSARRAAVDIEAWLENSAGISIPILAVASGEEPFGVVATLAVKVVAGDGGVLMDIDPMLMGFEFQDAARKAVEVARTRAGLPPDKDGHGIAGYDVVFLVVGPGEGVQVQAIDGPSAGAAATLALIAILENRSIKEGYVITGTINGDGSIGQVGGVFYKAQAAYELGATHMLVPPGQSVVTVYRQVTRKLGPWRFVSYEPVTLDLNAYAREQGWGLEIIEVSTIEEAAALMLE
jgi:predicted S18 family serine protease